MFKRFFRDFWRHARRHARQERSYALPQRGRIGRGLLTYALITVVAILIAVALAHGSS